ncbi:MAG: T9SS type A sorting domain-containing protein [Flavobacteriales bacterium]
MKSTFTFIFLLAFNLCFAQSYNGPESVDYDPSTNRYFISNSGNGQILEVGCDGSVSVFKSNIGPGPHGLEVIDSQLFACSFSKLKAFDLNNGNQTLDIELNAGFANGITHKDDDIFITDFNGKKIYRYDLSTGNFNVYISDLDEKPNGIFYDDINDRLLVVFWGSNSDIIQINLSDSSQTVLQETTLSNCDGITMDNNGDFYVSAWSNNAINKFDGSFEFNPTVVLNGMSNPADIYFNRFHNTLAIPNSGNNTVLFEGFGMNTTYNCENNECVDPGDGSGIYNSLECCQNLCTNTSEVLSNSLVINIPNPVKEGQQITFKQKTSVSLFDLKGKLIFNSHDKINSFFIPSLENGIYILKTQSKNYKLFIE